MSSSPLIVNGDLQLNANGDLQDGLDIQTQMPVTLSAYSCMYNELINSKVIPYLTAIQENGFDRITLTNHIVAAYKILISPRIIRNLQIGIGSPIGGYVRIRIYAIDDQGNEVQFSWMNPEESRVILS